MFYTPIPSIKPCSTHVNPRIRVFSPFLAFFALERQNCPPHAEKTATEAHRRPNSPAAPPRPSALRPVACPVARPLGLAPLWARGRGVCAAPFGSPRPAAVPPFCAPCSSLPSASDALLMRLNGALCADGREWAADNRALVPPGLRRRRPPRRRFAVRWRGRAVSGARGGGQLLPRPLAASPSSVWSAWPLAALSRASARRVGAWPVRPSGAPAACLRALAWLLAAASAVAWGRAGRSVSRGLAPLPPPRPSKGAPPFPPSVSPLRGSPPSGNYSGGRGARSRAPRLRRGRLRAGRAPLHPRCLCGLPPGLWPCALRLPRRVRRSRPAARVAPVVWWSGASGEGGAILQREHRGTGTRLRRSDRRRGRRLSPKARKKPPL